MTTLSEYLEARERLAKDLADGERIYPGRSLVLIYWEDLRTLLAGPPVSREDVARVIDPRSWDLRDSLHRLDDLEAANASRRSVGMKTDDQLVAASSAKADAVLRLFKGGA
jgi:hypothetical protein